MEIQGSPPQPSNVSTDNRTQNQAHNLSTAIGQVKNDLNGLLHHHPQNAGDPSALTATSERILQLYDASQAALN